MRCPALLDAMLSDLPPAHRIVWMCLETRAGDERFCSASSEEMAQELHLSVDTVSRAVKALADASIIKVQRRRRHTSVYRMQRSYPSSEHKRPTMPRRDAMPSTQDEGWALNTEARLAQQNAESRVKLTPQNAEPTSELTPQNAVSTCNETPRPSKEESLLSTPKEESPVPPDSGTNTIPVLTSSTVARARETTTGDLIRKPSKDEREHRLPEDWEPSESDRAYAIARNVNPDPMAEEFRLFWGSTGGKSARKTNWSKAFKVRVLACQDQGRFRLNGQPKAKAPARTDKDATLTGWFEVERRIKAGLAEMHAQQSPTVEADLLEVQGHG